MTSRLSVPQLRSLYLRFGHLTLLPLILLGAIYASGSTLKFEQMPDIQFRFAALFARIPPEYVPVVGISDGDTIFVIIDGKEETVRLLGIDTPETKDPRKPVQCFGREASRYTRTLVMGRGVKLIADPLQTDRDIYGRLLRYVQFEDGTTLNERLVYEGYAFAYEAYPDSRLAEYKLLEHDAKINQRGLWGGCETTIKNGGKNKSTNAVDK